VIKRGGGPALLRVAIPTLRDSILGGELAAVGIGVAGFAILGRPLKLDFVGAG